MSLSRKRYIEICGKCKNQKFDKKRGILCSLTNELPDFEIRCNSFELDKIQEKRSNRLDIAKGKIQNKSIQKNKNRQIMGVIMVVCGLIFLLVSLSIGKFSVVGFCLTLTGIFTVALAQKNKPVNMNRKIKSQNKNEIDEIY